MIEVWNKTDLLPEAERDAVARIADRRADVFTLSAWTGEGMAPLLAATSDTLSPPRHHTTLTLPHSDGRRRAWLFDQGIVETEVQGEDTTTLTVHWTRRQERAFAAL